MPFAGLASAALATYGTVHTSESCLSSMAALTQGDSGEQRGACEQRGRQVQRVVQRAGEGRVPRPDDLVQRAVSGWAAMAEGHRTCLYHLEHILLERRRGVELILRAFSPATLTFKLRRRRRSSEDQERAPEHCHQRMSAYTARLRGLVSKAELTETSRPLRSRAGFDNWLGARSAFHELNARATTGLV